MGFFDLSLPYSEPPRPGDNEVIVGKTLRLKLATKAMELGYVGIAHNRSVKGVMSDKDYCTIPLLTLGSLIKVAPRLASSVGFHRDLLGVHRATPFRQYTRITVHVENKAQIQSLNSGNPILKSYDIVAVRPLSQNAFNDACETAEVDLISIDFDKMPFRLKHPMVKAAIQRGIYFEIKYYDLLKDAHTRRQVISNAKLLVDWTKGKNLIISSGALSVTELRGPNDVINLMSLLGLSTERAKAAISKNCRNLLAKVLKKKRFHKEDVRVDLSSSSETFSLEEPLSGDCMKWDLLSSGEGDMLLDDLAKAFDVTSAVMHKSSKAIDYTSVLDGFRVKDIVGTDSLTQPPAAKVIDAPIDSNQVSELRVVVAASSDGNLQEIETISQAVDVQMSEDDSKVESTTNVIKEEAFGLRKCSTSQGHGLLLQNQAGASLTLIRCTKSDANDENHASIDDDEMIRDGFSEAVHEDMEVMVENQKLETGDNNINLRNLSSVITGMLRESSISLSPEAFGHDSDQVTRLESNETELEQEPSVSIPYHDTLETRMEDKKESETETEINHQANVQSSEINNATNIGTVRAKMIIVRLAQLRPFKPFLLQSRFKRISKRKKHRRAL